MTACAIAWSPGAAGPLLRPETPWDWTRFAECQYTDPDLFFAEGGDASAPDGIEADVARRICLGCPVRASCLAYALEAGEKSGMWGGLSEQELRRERDRATARPVAEIIAEADERYFARQDRRAEARDRNLTAMRERSRLARERLGLLSAREQEELVA